MKNIKGLTLIEVLITILIISILAGVAGPSFLRSFETRKLVSATEQFYSNLQLARSEALTRSTDIYVRLRGLGTTNWRYGISQTENCLPNETSNVATSVCFLAIDDGDGVYTAADDNVIHTIKGSEYEDISLALKNASIVGGQITFTYMNGTSNRIGSFVFTNSFGDSATVQLSALGTAKICSSDLVEYKSC